MSFLQNAKFTISVNNFNELPEDTGREIAFAGRSNAGKSSSINTISNQNRLVYVSKQPGRTQLINYFTIGEDKALVDLPGYGYAKVPSSMRKHWQTILPAYLQERQSLVGLIIVMDIRRPLTELDTRMLDWFAPRQKPIHILLTKSDKLSRDKSHQALFKTEKIVKEKWADFYQTPCSIQLFSSLNRTCVVDVVIVILHWLTL